VIEAGEECEVGVLGWSSALCQNCRSQTFKGCFTDDQCGNGERCFFTRNCTPPINCSATMACPVVPGHATQCISGVCYLFCDSDDDCFEGTTCLSSRCAGPQTGGP
jgi:hypothetical protein